MVKGHQNFVKALKSDSKMQTQVAIGISAVAKESQMKPSQKKFSATYKLPRSKYSNKAVTIIMYLQLQQIDLIFFQPTWSPLE